jgi:3-oxoacyl-[acyl-carrier-protein] synthase-3
LVIPLGIFGLYVSSTLIVAGDPAATAGNIMKGASPFLHNFGDRNTCILFGDGAGAVVLSASDEPGGALGLELTTEAQGAYMIWIPAGGSRSPASRETVARRQHFIRMEGKETYRFATRTLASTALTSIERAGLRPEDIDLFVPHQANIRIIQATARKLGLGMEHVVLTVDRHANTSAASIPLALDEAARDGRFRPGQHVLMEAIGGGFTWGAVLAKW